MKITIEPFVYKKLSFVHTLRKCRICSGASKIIRKSLFIRLSRFCGVFSYLV